MSDGNAATIITAIVALIGAAGGLVTALRAARKTEVETLAETLREMRCQVDNQAETVSRLHDENGKLHTSIIDLRRENDRLAIELELVRQRSAALEQENAALKATLAGLNAKVEEYRAGRPPTGPLGAK